MPIHEHFRDAVKLRATMAHQGQGYAYILPQERTRQRPIDLQLRSQLRDECQQWSHIRIVNGHGGIRNPCGNSQLWREWQQEEWQDQEWWEKS